MKQIVSIILIVFSGITINAQTFKLKAIVADNNGNPLKNIYVTTSGNINKHRSTNYKGLFTIKTFIGDTLLMIDADEIIYSIPVENQQNKKFILAEKNTEINSEGQLLQKLENIEKEKYKSIIQAFKTENPQLYYTSIFDMIKAEYPDLQVDEGSGNITIRGLNSLSNQAYALVVVDGVKGMDFRGLNPSDVESIKVIKDATAGIYGGRATGGVIEIKTKRSEK